MSPTLFVTHSVQEAKTSVAQYQEVRADERNGCPLTQREQSIAGLPSVANFQKVPCAFFLPWRLTWGGQQESVPEGRPGLYPSVHMQAAGKLSLHRVLHVSPLALCSR